MFCSVLIPSRGRANLLAASLASLESKSEDKANVEYLVRLDDDEQSSYGNLLGDSWLDDLEGKVTFGKRGNGYADLATYYDELAKQAKGDWLLLWNDDALMLTQNWDRKLKDWARNMAIPGDGIAMLVPKLVGLHGAPQLFWIHRNVFETLGRLSPIPHVDQWLHPLFAMLDRVYYVSIDVWHGDKEMTDLLTQDKISAQFQNAWYYRRMGLELVSQVGASRVEDLQKLAARMGK